MINRRSIVLLALMNAVTSAAIAQEAQKELIQNGRDALRTAAAGTGSPCKVLNEALFKLNRAPGPESEERRTMQTLLAVQISGAHCGGTGKLPSTDCAHMVAALDNVKKELVACRIDANCKKQDFLEPAFSMTFTESVKSCPRGDPRLAGLLGEVSVAVAPESAIRKTLELLANGSLRSDQVASLIDQIARQKNPDQVMRFLEAAMKSLRDANFEDRATVDAVVELLRLMNEAYSKEKGKSAGVRRRELLRQLARGGDLQELSQLLTALDALKVQENRRALKNAIDTLLIERPEIKDKLPADSNPTLEATLVSLVGLLNAAEMAELLHNQEEASRWPLLEESTRRLPMVVTTRLEPCLPSSGGPSDPACQQAMKIRVEFLKGVQGKAFFGAEAVDLRSSTADVLATAESVIQHRSCPPLPDGDPRKDALCRGPFSGVLVLEIKKSGVDGPLVGQVAWLARRKNMDVARCSMDGTGHPCPEQRFDVELPKAEQEAFELGKRAVVECNIGKTGPSILDPPPPVEPLRFGWAGSGARAAAFSGLPWLVDGKPSNDWAGWLAAAAEVGFVVGGAYYLHHGIDLRNDAAKETGARKNALLGDAARSVDRGTGMLLIGIPVTRVLSWLGYGLTQ